MLLGLNIGNFDIRVTAEPLSQQAFAPFGHAISNVRPDVHPSAFAARASTLPPNAVTANQGTAIQYRDVSRVRNLYGQAPSGRGEPKMTMFVCAARPLPTTEEAPHGQFTVRLMERHPFTTQTFTPVASSASSYLVVVAPSLGPGEFDRDLPVPEGDDDLPGRGLPDLRRLRAFVATGAQAVTYGAGTWHAPMVVLGEEGTTMDFVVFQFGSGEGVEDCQLVEFESPGVPEPRVVAQLARPRSEKL